MVEIPEVAKDSDKFPKFVISIRLDNMPDAIDFSKDLRVKSRLTQLDPLFESPLQISKICGTNETPMSSSNDEDLTYVLLHPNGKTIQDIIKENDAISLRQFTFPAFIVFTKLCVPYNLTFFT